MRSQAPAEPDVPRTLDDVSAEFLTGLLRECGAIAAHEVVESVQPQQIAVHVGFLSDLYRLQLTGDGPASVILKLPTTTMFRASGDSGDVYRREVDFYRHLAPDCPVRTPRAYAAAVDPSTGGTVLVLEDLGTLDACDNLLGLPLERMQAVIDALARFHAWGFGITASVDPAQYPTLRERWCDGVVDAVVAMGWPLYQTLRRRDHPASIDRLVEQLPAAAVNAATSLEHPEVLHHGDLRVDNLFFEGNEPVFVDFQFCTRGSGIADVAYLLSQGVRPDDRRGHERSLIDRYADAVAAAGMPIDHESAWHQFVDAATLLVFMPLGALLGWDAMGDRARDLILTLIERWIDTMIDLGDGDLSEVWNAAPSPGQWK